MRIRVSGLFLSLSLAALLLSPAAAPLAQSDRRAGGPACRVGLATYRIVMKGPGGFTATTEGSCTFDAAAVEGTCTNEYSDTAGQRYRSVSVTRHASVADVVEEVSVNPPRPLSLGTTTTISGSVPASTNTSTAEYDASRRLISVAAESRPSGQRSTTTYTAWDAAGRPTMATVVAGRQTSTLSTSYDDARRSQTMTSTGTTCTQTFDVNGNPVAGACPGSTTTTTVLTTQRICR